MSLWMIALLFNFFLLVNPLKACELNSQFKSYYSLSGPVTDIFYRFGLLKNSSLKAISIYHPVREQDFLGDILPGGIFVGHEKLRSMKEGIVFYDESIDLKKMLKLSPSITAVEINTRNLTPPLVLIELEKKLSPFLKGCVWRKVHQEMGTRLELLRKLVGPKPFILFFLGHPIDSKWPGTLMVNDGVMKWLQENQSIQTFPSTLSYVQWSAKLMNEIPKKHLKLGIKDSGRSYEMKVEKVSDGLKLTYPGSLNPGFGQVNGLVYLFEHLKN